MRDTAPHSLFRQLPRAAAFAAALAVCPLFVQPASAQARIRVDSIEVVGNKRVSTPVVLSNLAFQVGDSIGGLELNRSVSRLWSTGQFKDVELFTIQDSTSLNNPIKVRIQVEEQPLVTSIEFIGLEHISGSAVQDTAMLRANTPLRPGQVAQAEQVTRSLLARKGFFVRNVEHEMQPVEGRDNEVRLIFTVEEGQRVAIADIQFEGNEVFPDEALADAMGTKTEGFLFMRMGTYNEENLRTDVRERLPQLYMESGYLDFAVVKDSIFVDEVTGKARLIVTVAEGPQYVLAEFDVRGNRRFPTDELRRYFEAARGGLFGGLVGATRRPVIGEPFDAVAFERATLDVQGLYNNTGYIYANVRESYDRLPADSADPRPRVRAVWNIEEGAPAFINTVRIEGNTYTHENVIRQQILVLPGDLYSQELLVQSYRRISALGFFESPLPTPQVVPTETGDVDITFIVRERQTGSVNFGTSLGGATGLAGFLGYDQPNLFGQAKSGHLRWEFGRYSNNFEASYTDPSIRGSVYSGSLSVFSSRDRFFTFAEGQRRRTGAALRFGVPFWLDPRYTRFTFGYSLARTTYEEFEEETESSLFRLPPGVLSSVAFSIRRSAIDHPVFPTDGNTLEAEYSLNGGPLGGDGEFQKFNVAGSWYTPVAFLGGGGPAAGRPLRFTLGLTVEAGGIFGDAGRFPFERFWMGGVQFGRPLRGYDETTITPSGYLPREANVPLDVRFGDAFFRLSAEWAARFNDNISLSLFYDAGNVWRAPSEINPTRLARGAGVGLTLVTPFGPLGLDYAYGFDKTPPGWQLHFKFGQGF
jgi:outer membrane protein insertion porin family